jgi:CheY-like chemotaxis protein
VRLRCARCEAVFRVRPPEAPEAAPAPTPVVEPKRDPPLPSVSQPMPSPRAAEASAAPGPKPAGDLVLVAMPDGDVARRTCEVLAQRGLGVLRASDGVEAMLEIQRKLPRALVLAAELPKMYGFQICEVVKRNESLRGIWVVLVGAIHHRERYRRAPGELYGADVYVEGPELPAGLLPLLVQGGVAVQDDSARVPLAARPAAPSTPEGSARVPLAARPAAPGLWRRDSEAPAAPQPSPPARPVQGGKARLPLAARPAQAAPAPVAVPAPRRSDGLDEERAKAERLARIVVSDIVLYNEDRFAAAVRRGNVLEAMASDLGEGRQLFEERIDGRVRAERDHLKDELLRRAQARGMP